MADWPRYIAICLVYLALAKTSRRHLLQKPSPICEFFEPCFLSSVATASGAARNHHWAGQKHWSSQTDPNIQYTYTVSYIYIYHMGKHGKTSNKSHPTEQIQTQPSNGFHRFAEQLSPRTPGPPTLTWRESSTSPLHENRAPISQLVILVIFSYFFYTVLNDYRLNYSQLYQLYINHHKPLYAHGKSMSQPAI